MWGGGDRLESPDEANSIFVMFFACVFVVFVRFWGVVDIVCFIE